MFKGSALPRVKLTPQKHYRTKTSEIRFVDIVGVRRFVEENSPYLWLGSAVSVPSGLPTGISLTRSIAKWALTPIIFEATESSYGKKFVAEIAASHSLEEIFDLARAYDVDMNFIYRELHKLSDSVEPNVYHVAACEYYRRCHPDGVLFTTNWDMLFEKAFLKMDVPFRTLSTEDSMVTAKGSYDGMVCVHHVHGCFEHSDIVTSVLTEQRDIDFPISAYGRPLLVIGYSGYEPSVFEKLYMSIVPQLWCVYSKKELDDPIKRRLMLRDNVSVYIGDMKDIFDILHKSGGLQPPPSETHQQWDKGFGCLKATVRNIAFSLSLLGKAAPGFVLDLRGPVQLTPLVPNFIRRATDYNAQLSAYHILSICRRIYSSAIADHAPCNSVFSFATELFRNGGARAATELISSVMLRQVADIDKIRNILLATITDDIDEEFDGFVKQFPRDISTDYLARNLLLSDDAMPCNELSTLVYLMESYCETSEQAAVIFEIAGHHCLRQRDSEQAKHFFDASATYHYLHRNNFAGDLLTNLATKIHDGGEVRQSSTLNINNSISISNFILNC